MDAISYAHSAKQEQRIKKFINDPDSTSGVLTVPKVIAAGETITISAGRMAILPNVQIDGTLDIQGEVFIPSGATTTGVVEKVTSTDNALVRFNGTTGDIQNSGVIVDDNNNLGIGMNPTAVAGYNIISKNGANGSYDYYYMNGTQSAYIGGYNQALSLGALGSSSFIQFQTNGSERMRIDSNGNVLVTNIGGIGYGTGAGGTVTQLTSPTTTVTLNKPTGTIYMHSGSIAPGASVGFLVNNSLFNGATDVVVINPGAYGDNYRFEAYPYSTNQFKVRVTNITGNTLSESRSCLFNIFKGATS